MNTDETRVSHLCGTADDLMALGERIARELRGGEVFALEGDLGLGKTTFVKGLARGLGSPATVTSPTFNLVHRYEGGRLTLAHYDLYRLKSPRELESLDLDAEVQGGGVVAIEWPGLARSILPVGRTRWVGFEETEEGGRRVICGAMTGVR